MLRHLSLALLMFVCVHSHATDWMKLAEEDHAAMYMDADSVVMDGPIRKLWLLLDLESPEITPGNARQQYSSVKSLVYFYCDRRTFQYRSMVYHLNQMGQGKVMERLNTHGSIQDVEPDTMIEMLFTRTCQ